MNIARKLAVGFGLLVALTLSSAGVSYLGSRQATIKINTTGKVRVPIALDASSAQANVRGYLALGNQDLGR